jgi:ubiquinol-cytochrome c reductase cytochrome c1 subunit
MRARIFTAVSAALIGIGAAAGPAVAAEGTAKAPEQQWSFDGLFGTFDRAGLQRGFQVYKEVCSACHSMNLLAYRHLTGIGLGEEEVKAVAASYQITDGPNDEGEMFERPGIPADRFAAPFPNPQAARAANNGALPPDLSAIVKGREDGSNYLYGLLTGYEEPPADIQMFEGMSYNRYFPGHQIAMAPPLSEDAVTYADGTAATVEQMAHDVTMFLTWASYPELEERKESGVAVILFLILLTAMLYAAKKKIWSDLH